MVARGAIGDGWDGTLVGGVDGGDFRRFESGMVDGVFGPLSMISIGLVKLRD